MRVKEPSPKSYIHISPAVDDVDARRLRYTSPPRNVNRSLRPSGLSEGSMAGTSNGIVSEPEPSAASRIMREDETSPLPSRAPVQRIVFPSADHAWGTVPSVSKDMRSAAPPAMSATYTLPQSPPRVEQKATFLPSGLMAGHVSSPSERANSLAVPPFVSADHRWPFHSKTNVSPFPPVVGSEPRYIRDQSAVASPSAAKVKEDSNGAAAARRCRNIFIGPLYQKDVSVKSRLCLEFTHF